MKKCEQSKIFGMIVAICISLLVSLQGVNAQFERPSSSPPKAKPLPAKKVTTPPPKPRPMPTPKTRHPRIQKEEEKAPVVENYARSMKFKGDYTESLGAGYLGLMHLPGGTFTMGSPSTEAERSAYEGPQHQVKVAAFYMGKYEVTQGQWEFVMGNNPSNFKGIDLPVENVSWEEAKEFCRKLSDKTGKAYRLPSEGEWEYACRGGRSTPFAFGSSLSSEEANFNGNYPYGGAVKGVYRGKTVEVGSYKANEFGLYDLHGNVWEWCEDVWHENYNGAPNDGTA